MTGIGQSPGLIIFTFKSNERIGKTMIRTWYSVQRNNWLFFINVILLLANKLNYLMHKVWKMSGCIYDNSLMWSWIYLESLQMNAWKGQWMIVWEVTCCGNVFIN